MPACLICSARPSSETRELLASWASRSFILRYCAMPLALSRSAMTRKVSPASGMAFETEDLDRGRWAGFGDRRGRDRRTWRGSCRRCCRRCSCRRCVSVPFCTRMEATAPRPRSSLASMTVPTAGRSGWAFCSLMSATRQIISSRPSRLMRFLAETSTNSVSPPMVGGLHAAGRRAAA